MFRPVRLALCLALAFAASLLTVPGEANADVGPIMFGVYPSARLGQGQQQVLESLEAEVGRTLPGVRVFDLWNQQFPSGYDTWLRDSGHTLFLSVKSMRMNGTVVRWRDIANAQAGSTLYGEIAGWAAAVRDFGAPIYFTFNHEPEAGASRSMGTATEYIAAWRRIVTIFRDLGVSNARFAWIVTAYAFRVNDSRRDELWYPGDAYVDAVGVDAYNWYDCRTEVDSPWRTMEFLLEDFRTWGLDHPGVELLVTEWASHEDDSNVGRKAAWIAEARALFKEPGWEQFTTLLYYHNANRASCDFWLDSSPSALAAWAEMGRDPFYGRGTTSSDTTAPTVPGQPTGTSVDAGAIDLTWSASTDDVASSLVYAVYRDGGATPVGTVSSSSTTTVSFRDAGLTGGSTHWYEVTASDGANTSARSPASAPITVSGPSAIFADGFDDGFSAWTQASGMTIDQTMGQPAPPSARAQTTASRAWAYRPLGGTYPSICVSMRVNLTSTTDGASLVRLRTAGDGPIVRVAVNRSRVLLLRSDVSGAQVSSGSALAIGTWTLLEICGSPGSTGSWSLYRDGTRILGPWTANTGTSPVGAITIGPRDPRTITVNVDDVVVDLVQG